MNINGTNKSDNLVGTAADDVINGLRGNDWIEGGQGNDILTGGSSYLHDPARDKFVLRNGDGNDTVTDFQLENGNGTGDRLLFDFAGTYSDVAAPLGALYDGQTWQWSDGFQTATVLVENGDFNSDGVGDVRFTVSGPDGGPDDSITLLGQIGTAGLFAEDMTSAYIQGG